MKKVSIITLGCKVNLSESESLAHSLEREGFEVSEKMEWADIFVVNTCAVTSEAEKKSRMSIAKIKKINPDAKVFVCGCASECDTKQFEDKNVSVIYGSMGKGRLIQNIVKESDEFFDMPHDQSVFEELDFAKKQRTRAFIKIQDGCNNFCSYCVIPHLRGRERSRSLDSIKAEIESLPFGTKEVVLIGINLSAWGREINRSLCDVVDLCSVYQNLRFRFGSLESNIVGEDLLFKMKEAKNFCDHFHLSLQSGCDITLAKMNRKYTVSEFMKQINIVRKHFPSAGITTDVIVGFPTESEDNFEETLKNIERMKFSDIHIFTYSRRKGTPAAKFAPIDGKIVKKRAERLESLRKTLKENFLQSHIGKTLDVLVEEKTKRFFDGLSTNYIRCLFESTENLSQKVVRAVGEKVTGEGLFCKIIEVLN